MVYTSAMVKDFAAWHSEKSRIDMPAEPQLLYKEREVWWMRVGFNVGAEQNGSHDTFSRPVVIVKGFSKTLFWGVPLSNTRNRSRYVVSVVIDGLERAANVSQLRALDTRRIGTKIGMISQKDMSAIKNRLSELVLE